MRSLIWKEWRENLKWAVLLPLLILGCMALLGAFPLLYRSGLFFVCLFTAVSGAGLGFLQVFFESSGDKRALLLHRPLSRSRIFLGKVLAGAGLYLAALGISFAGVVVLAATPGHVAQPFSWPMALPLLADSLTGFVYYFAGMLMAQREARWYGSRCLSLAAGLGCSYLVWIVPEFWQALGVIVLLGGTVAVAAWGSFLAGGAYTPQPRLARLALAVTFLVGLLALSFTGKVLVGAAYRNDTRYSYYLDREGRVLVVQREGGRIRNITDLEGRFPQELQNKWLDDHALQEIQAIRGTTGDWSGPRTESYRGQLRFLVHFENRSKPGHQAWWYVPDQGRLLGYDRESKQFVGSYGPDGFCPPNEQPRDRFRGELLSTFSVFYVAWAEDYLTYADRVYTVDFHRRTVRTLFVAPAGETIRWAFAWNHDERDGGCVATDKAIYLLDEAGAPLLSMPRLYDPEKYELKLVDRLDNPQQYRVWHVPHWYLKLETLETLPGYVVEYDAAGHETARRTLPARLEINGYFRNPLLELAEPSDHQVWFGLATAPAEGAVLVGATRHLFADFRASQGREMLLLLQFLEQMTTVFIPGAGWNMPIDRGLVVGFTALMLLAAAVSALVCFLLARRYSFPRAHCLGWSLVGLLFGFVGLLLMLAVQEWPARITCPSCRQPRRVDRDRCEYCGAPHASPALDGTEIFETTAAADAALARH